MNNQESTLIKSVDSPCIRQCCLDEQDICVGCKRSIQEILDWSQANPERKQKILENCRNRAKLDEKDV
ncbi:DUF1289 domain-containing protein [Planctobacterium marinum]|uniref:DUF1289 domain-containing protein n=1 Tax=Planctobacterium marinum TaxID=1631968 RepID=A0AA48KRH9_9ALTE|nr:hypothetical protein MACH26_16580 [Planctobacterium marinum]